MADEATEAEQAPGKVETPFDDARRETRRAQWALNTLVVFSAVAGSFFFVYVLQTISPFGKRTPDEVGVPTSQVGARHGLLVGTDVGSGLAVTLRDIDDAPEYRDRLSDNMRQQLGIGGAGRLYLLEIRNEGAATVDVSAEQLSVTDKAGRNWTVQWLDQAANPQTAGPTGRLRLTQSQRAFALPKGAMRQLYVFISDAPPPAEEFMGGMLKLAGVTITLSHTETKAQ